MAKKRFLLGMLAVLVFGIVAVSCGGDSVGGSGDSSGGGGGSGSGGGSGGGGGGGGNTSVTIIGTAKSGQTLTAAPYGFGGTPEFTWRSSLSSNKASGGTIGTGVTYVINVNQMNRYIWVEAERYFQNEFASSAVIGPITQ